MDGPILCRAQRPIESSSAWGKKKKERNDQFRTDDSSRGPLQSTGCWRARPIACCIVASMARRRREERGPGGQGGERAGSIIRERRMLYY